MIAKKLTAVLTIIEHIIVMILMAILLITICYATYLMVMGVYNRLMVDNLNAEFMQNPDALQMGLYRTFGSMLTILLGLELIHTIKIYFAKNLVKIESILVISVIAIARHLIQLDFHHTDPMLLMAVALTLFVLLSAYLVLTRWHGFSGKD